MNGVFKRSLSSRIGKKDHRRSSIHISIKNAQLNARAHAANHVHRLSRTRGVWYRVGPPAVRVVRAVRGVFGNHAVSSNRLGKRRRGRSRHHFSNPGVVVVVVFVVVPGSRRRRRRVWWTRCGAPRNGRDSVSRMRGATDVRLGRDAGALRVVSHRE